MYYNTLKQMRTAALLCCWFAISTQANATAEDKAEAPAATEQAEPKPATTVRNLFDVRTPMRDGVELSSDVWMPREPGKYPIILLRTPYIKSMTAINMAEFGRYFAEHGYAYVIQDVRGRGDSGGEFDFFFQEANDGYDSIEWLAKQPWSNGRVCMMGASYWGTVQWLAARERPPHLVCIAPTAPAGRYLNELPYVGGAFMTGWALPWLNDVSGHISQGANAAFVDWDRVNAHRPLITADEVLGRRIRLYREFLEHPTMDAYWRRIYFTPEDFRKIDLPMMTVTGLFDGDQPGAMHYWQGIETYGKPSADRYLVLGPWTHVQTLMGGAEKIGEFEFSKASILDNKQMHLDFFDRYLKQSRGALDWPHVRVYVTGRNEWRSFDKYPVAATPTRLFLSSEGKANSNAGDGKLLRREQRKSTTDRFTYDPKHPVDMGDIKVQASDMKKLGDRADVLVYTSEPLDSALEVIGPVEVEVYAASDGRDTDFTAQVLDVYPDGRAAPLGPNSVGIIRARYRNGNEKEELLQPGKVERYRIDLGHVAHAFLPGHRIRVHISSSFASLFNPNQNTGNPVATDTEWRTAQQTIYHDTKRPSAVILPVVSPK